VPNELSGTREVVVRLYEPPDARHLWEAVRETADDIAPWMDWAPAAYSIGDAERWIAAQQELAAQGAAYEFGVWDAGRYLGGCGINKINRLHRFANLGYWTRTSAAGRGVAVAAVAQVAAYGFDVVGLNRLEIVCAVGNVRSQRVAEKCGALREGVLRNRLLLPSGPTDAVMFGLVPTI
jgi:ribosomal-protein-serine acetyltransferase